MNPTRCRDGAAAVLIGLILFCVAWEIWLAPLRPGGSMLALKVLPLLLPLFGVLRGKVYTFKWSVLLIWFYVFEGITRAMTDQGLSRWLAGGEIALCLAYFGLAACYVRRLGKAAA